MALIRLLTGSSGKEGKTEAKSDIFFGGRAKVPGYDHVNRRQNCQDEAGYGEFEFNGQTYRVGISIDGCGSGVKSEVGAILANRFVGWEIGQLIFAGTPFREIPGELFESLSMEMWRTLPQYRTKNEIVQFVLDCLLFTLFVFVQGPSETIVFFIGDGIVCLNGNVVIGKERKIASKNAPDYLTYALISKIDRNYFRDHKKEESDKVYVPKKAFEVLSFPTAEVDQLIIGTDAWHDAQAALAELMAMIPRLEPTNVSPVQLKMNVWAGIPFRALQSRPQLLDDASIAFIQRVAEKKEEKKDG